MTKIKALMSSIAPIIDEQYNESQFGPLEEGSDKLLRVKSNVVKMSPLKTLKDIAKLGIGDDVYSEDGKFHAHRYTDSLHITALEGAMKAGKKCKVVRLYSRARDVHAPLRYLEEMHETYDTIEEYMDEAGRDYEFEGVSVSVSEEKAKGIFSPHAAVKLKPLTAVPKRWNIDHLAKILANGQFTHLKQNFYYTDDYAYDAADNFRKDIQLDVLKQLKEVVERDVELNYATENADGTISLSYGAHSNDSRVCVFAMDVRAFD